MLDAEFLWPIDRPMHITGTFGEYRSVRFHHGIDISCARKKGFKIFAADDGYISTVIYQKWGIGYALFIKHKNGLTTFYGHLDRFSGLILQNNKVNVYRGHILDRRDFRIDFDGPELPVKRGEVIGYSGDSGIGIEHFHFEVRDKNNNPLNPLRSAFRVRDTSAPVIKELYIAPLDSYSHVDMYSSEIFFNAKLIDRKRNIYTIDSDHMPVIAGNVGLKVRVYDRAGSWNRVSLYKVESYIDNQENYRVVFDRINRDLTHRMGLYYDYDNSSYSSFTYYLYSRINKNGVIRDRKNGDIIEVKILCSDANLNNSTLIVRFKIGRALSKPDYDYRPNLFPGRSLEFRSADNNFKIEFDKKSLLYEEMLYLNDGPAFHTFIKGLSLESRVYSTGPTNLCIEEKAKIKIKYIGDDFKKIGIYGIIGNSTAFYFLDNVYDPVKKEFLAETWKMGRFFLVRDDSPPKTGFRNGTRLKRNSTIRISARDIGTGIDLQNIYLNVDGKNVIWDFDPDKSCIEILPHNDIWKRGRHYITIMLQDRAGNSSKKRQYYYIVTGD